MQWHMTDNLHRPNPKDHPPDGETIRLDQFLKVQRLCSTGGLAKAVVQRGLVEVNGKVELRRGRKLRQGDVVSYDGYTVPVDFD